MCYNIAVLIYMVSLGCGVLCLFSLTSLVTGQIISFLVEIVEDSLRVAKGDHNLKRQTVLFWIELIKSWVCFKPM